MKIVLSTSAKFHTFALARELLQRGLLNKVISGYPLFKLKNEFVPSQLILSRPFFQLSSQLMGRLGLQRLVKECGYWNARHVDEAAFNYIRQLQDIDVYMALSSTGTKSGEIAKRCGATYICDRGSSHILYQEQVLKDEYRSLGMEVPFFDPRIIERELEEYDRSDAITVPSEFVRRSFIAQGVNPEKLAKVPYGSNLGRFYPTADKSKENFEVLFVGALSVRKGIRYLFEAFSKFKHPRKRLTLIGAQTPDFAVLQRYLPSSNVQVLGVIPNAELKEYMSSAHVMVLPSVEEGLALVMGEALACGCPVVATENTGAEDLFDHGTEGFIVPNRDSVAICERLQFLADNPLIRAEMSLAARKRMESAGGWSEYGHQMSELFKTLRRA